MVAFRYIGATIPTHEFIVLNNSLASYVRKYEKLTSIVDQINHIIIFKNKSYLILNGYYGSVTDIKKHPLQTM